VANASAASRRARASASSVSESAKEGRGDEADDNNKDEDDCEVEVCVEMPLLLDDDEVDELTDAIENRSKREMNGKSQQIRAWLTEEVMEMQTWKR
jgi:hypothetical protein